MCVFPRSTLPCADTPYPMLVLTGPQGCGKRELSHRLCQDLCEFFAYGSVFRYLYFRIDLSHGNSPSGNNQPYLHIMFASTESVTPQGGLTTVSRMALITISSTRQSFRAWFTRCVSSLFSPFDLRSKWKKSCARSDYEQIDILAFKLKYWKCLLARRHPPFRQS